MLQNAYFLAKIVADTAENEQHFAEIAGRRVASLHGSVVAVGSAARRVTSCSSSRSPPAASTANLGKLRRFCKILACSFSAVSKRTFARKDAFDSNFQALQDVHTSAPLRSQNFRKSRFSKAAIFVKIQQTIWKCCKICKICQISIFSAR